MGRSKYPVNNFFPSLAGQTGAAWKSRHLGGCFNPLKQGV
jgi:hypothetical protein